MSITVLAAPYTARQCPVCEVWVYVDDGPFAENDRTKTQADAIHYETAHADLVKINTSPDGRVKSMSFPYMFWNKEPVEAVKEGT